MEAAMTRLALVIGVTGGVGQATAKALLARGWRVRAMHRNPEAARAGKGLSGIEWVQGDAMNRNDVVAAAQGARVILHGANPPRYRNWRALAIPMLANTIEAALVTGARILFPGNVYNFGPDAGALVGEDAPQHPQTRKGRVRVEMEAMLRAATEFGVRSIVLRAGDFLGAGAPSSWFQAAMVKPGKQVRSLLYPGAADVGHAWAYLPDLGETFARLADREQALPDFETFHFGGHWLERGADIGGAVARATGQERLPVRPFPWLAVYAAAPFVEMFREMIEMRYLWKQPLQLDNTKLVAFLGGEPRTDFDEAIRATLDGLGCLDPGTSGRVAMTMA
jgi:nucleoside-diphosphate-sugar epimerase